MYWSRYKVYLFGKFALFPERYTDVDLKYNDFKSFIAYHHIEQLVTELKEYEKSGYFKVSIKFSREYINNEIAKNKMSYYVTLNPGRGTYKNRENYGLGNAINAVKNSKPLLEKELNILLEKIPRNELERYLKFTISNINKEKFITELMDYLKKYKNNRLTTGGITKPEVYENQISRLLIAIKKYYNAQRLRPIINVSDVWSNPHNDVALYTFWELLLTQQVIFQNINIINMGYKSELINRKHRGMIRSESLVASPYAEIEIINEKIIGIISGRSQVMKIQQPSVIYPNITANKISNLSNKIENNHEVYIILKNHYVSLEVDRKYTYTIKSLRYDSPQYNFIKYILNNTNRYIDISIIHDEVSMCKAKHDMTELVRECGFNRNSKKIFFPNTTSTKVYFNKTSTLTDKQIRELLNRK